MTEKELRKLNRYQLLELLISQTQRADKLQARLDEAMEHLVDKQLNIATLGSLAEASLQVSGVFQAAQEAADQYLEGARKEAEQIRQEAHRKAAEILSQAQAQANRIKGE